MKKLIFFIALHFITSALFCQTSPCDVIQISHNPNDPVFYSPDSSKYFITHQDTSGVFQIYVGNAGDTNTVCISDSYTTGNCCGLFRHWKMRNKVMVQWHPSGNYIICGVEKEYYNELLYVPYSLLLGWIQSGLWLDVWAVTPDGSHWYNLANTEHGFTGPAFTPDGTKGVYAEAKDSSNLSIDKFGVWRFKQVDFNNISGTPSFSNTTDISPPGARWLEPGNFGPDGVSLLFNSDIGMSNAEGQDQYIMNISTGNVIDLTNSPMVWDEHGIFSPDGNKILFMSSYPYQADTNTYHTATIKTEFMLMNTDGSGLQQLTHFRTPGYFESSPGIAATGFWSHDGSMIYAQSLIFPDYDNWIIQFNGNCGNANLTSVDEQETNSLQVFPNPVHNTFTIESDVELINTEITIINSVGQTVKKLKGQNGNKISIDTEDLKSGIYFLQLKSDHHRMSGKFMKAE